MMSSVKFVKHVTYYIKRGSCGLNPFQSVSSNVHEKQKWCLSTTGLTCILICLYNEMILCSANHDKALIMLHHKLAHETIVLKPSMTGRINDRIYLLTNQQAVLTA